MKQFCSASTELGISTYKARELRDILKKLKTDDATVEMVYQNRGNLIAAGFKQMFCEDRWFDITIEVECIPFAAYRLALSLGSDFFRQILEPLEPSTVQTIGMKWKTS